MAGRSHGELDVGAAVGPLKRNEGSLRFNEGTASPRQFDQGVPPNRMPSEITTREALEEVRPGTELSPSAGTRGLVAEMNAAALRVVGRNLGALRGRMDGSGGTSGEHPPLEHDTLPKGLVLRPALLGFVAMLAIAIGASLPSSPFKLEMPGVWFFGVPSTETGSQWGV